ncbi:MAG: nucleoside recognition domain-containing protein [Firmicutes bacterium]|nr:spore maturation protein [Bacillota bacterium]MDD7602897.1 nucleoside recognition domain-containing protein [Bacillota bacterium]MDY5856556.1 nucleoside recognition domain-containing protein [Anaerovoracaceae bacterium]
MLHIISLITVGFIPAMAAVIIAYGLLRHAPVYDYFIEGARKGLETALDILPFLIGIFLAISCLTASGLLGLLNQVFHPLFQFLGIPPELLPLLFLRAVSGSGSMILVQNILETCGPDSYAGRVACVMSGGCETIIYVLALYFGVTGAKKTRHALKGGLIGYLTGVAVSLLICRIL